VPVSISPPSSFFSQTILVKGESDQKCGLYFREDTTGQYCVQDKCNSYYYLGSDGTCHQVACKPGY